MTDNHFTDHPLLESVKKATDQPVLQVTMFQRVDADTARHLTSKISPMAGMMMRFVGKKRAGGLPNMGIFVLTKDQFKAYSCKGGGMSMRPKEEVACWERSGLRISTEAKGGITRITLESPAEGEKVTVESLQGYEPMMNEIVAALQ